MIPYLTSTTFSDEGVQVKTPVEMLSFADDSLEMLPTM